jgi:hypothetical protein
MTEETPKYSIQTGNTFNGKMKADHDANLLL